MRARIEQARFHVRKGQSDEARSILRKILDTNVSDESLFPLYLSCAKVAIDIVDYDLALQFVDLILRENDMLLNKEYGIAHLLKSDIYQKQGLAESSRKELYTAGSIYLQASEFQLDRYDYPAASKLATAAISVFLAVDTWKSELVQAYDIERKSLLGLYSDLVTMGNYHRYSQDVERGKKFVWRALIYGLECIAVAIKMTHLNNGLSNEIRSSFLIKETVSIIRNKLEVCNKVLLHNQDEKNPVVLLKLDMLKKFMDDLSDDIPDKISDVDNWIAIQKESLKYLLPIIPPSFMLITPDGKLIHFYNAATAGGSERMNSTQNLLAGALMAINSIFYESRNIGGGHVNKIHLADSSMIIERRKNIVVVAICDVVFKEIEDFTVDLANQLQERYGSLLHSWVGDKSRLADMLSFTENRVSEFSY